MPRSLLAALVAALAATMPAAAWAQGAPTLTFDKPCYAKDDPMEYSGTGYTPGGEINFLFSSLSNQSTGSYDTHADAAGAIAGTIAAPSDDDVLADGDTSGTMGATANDRTRIDQGAPAEQQFAGTAFRLTRWDVDVERPGGSAPKARKPMRVTAYGFTRVIGKPLYLQYRRGSKLLRAVKLGRLRGECGDLTRTLPRGLPRGLRPGRYTLVFTTSPRSAHGERVWFKQSLR
jgi:hypothetical protein